MIRDISFDKTPIRVTSSTLELHDTLLTSINDRSSREIFLVNGESKFLTNNLTYENSNTKLVRSLAGEVELNTFSAVNISNFNNLLQFYSCTKVFAGSLKFESLVPSSDQLILIKNSENISIEDFRVSGVKITAISLLGSRVDSLKNLQISNCSKALSISHSHVSLISESRFTNDGVKNGITAGGAILTINSDVEVANTTFENNTAGRAGAIAFDCDSVTLCSLALKNITFTNNEASVQGGAVHYNLKRPEITG